MGTVCSTSRSVQVRENKGNPGDTRCNPSPPKYLHYKEATTYTHRYTSLHTKQEDQSLIVTNPYALSALESKKSEEQLHFIVTVDEPTKVHPIQETEITHEQPASPTSTVSNTSQNEPQPEQAETAETTDNETENIINSQQLESIVKAEITELELLTITEEPSVDSIVNTELIQSENSTVSSPNQDMDITDNAEPIEEYNSAPEGTETVDSPVPCQTEEYFEDVIHTPPRTTEYTNASPFKEETTGLIADSTMSPNTDAFENTIDISNQGNSTVLGNETTDNEDSEKYTQLPPSPEIYHIQDDTTQGLEADLTNVTRELDEAATDIVETVLNKNVFEARNIQTENIKDETNGNTFPEIPKTDIEESETKSIDRDSENDI